MTKEVEARLNEGDREGAVAMLDETIAEAFRVRGRGIPDLHYNKAVVGTLCVASS